MKLIKLANFQSKYFDNGSAPSKDTLIKLIETQELKGMRIGHQYFIDVDSFNLPNLSFILEHENHLDENLGKGSN